VRHRGLEPLFEGASPFHVYGFWRVGMTSELYYPGWVPPSVRQTQPGSLVDPPLRAEPPLFAGLLGTGSFAGGFGLSCLALLAGGQERRDHYLLPGWHPLLQRSPKVQPGSLLYCSPTQALRQTATFCYRVLRAELGLSTYGGHVYAPGSEGKHAANGREGETGEASFDYWE
jgi:hypothetical protein